MLIVRIQTLRIFIKDQASDTEQEQGSRNNDIFFEISNKVDRFSLSLNTKELHIIQS